MYQMSSKSEKLNKYYDIKTNVIELLKAMGTVSDLKMSITYVNLGREENTKHYFLFCPYITGMERVWKEQDVKPWNQEHITYEYRELMNNVYIKDDFINVPVELYTHLKTIGYDFALYEYNEKQNILQYATKDMYLYVTSFRDIDKKEMEFNIKNIDIIFPSPMKNSLPFPVKNIHLMYPSKECTFFKVQLTDDPVKTTYSYFTVKRE